MRGDQCRGQLLGASERRQRFLKPAPGQLQGGASVTKAHPGGRFHLGAQGTLGTLQPRICLIQPPLVQQHDAELGVGHPGERLLAPAMPFRQLDRLPAPLRLRRIGPEQQHPVRPVGQAVELQVRPPDLARQVNAPLQMPLGIVELKGPDLGDAEADERRRAQILAQPELRGLGGLHEREQPPRLPHHDREVVEAPGQEEPQHGEQDLKASPAVGGHRRQRSRGRGQVTSGVLQGSPDQIAGHSYSGEFRVGRDGPAGKPGQQLDQGGAPPAEEEVEPVVRQQPGGQPPVRRGLGLADRLDRVPVPGEPCGGRAVQRGPFVRLGAAQLQLQQVREQPVVAEPRPARVQRDHERAGLLQILQDPFPARGAGQHVRQRAGHPLQHRRAQEQSPHLLALPVQHLGQQVLGHRPIGAGELRGEPLRVRVPGQRQRGQPQPGHPALGPSVQPGQHLVRQLHSGGAEQRARLGQAEPQIGRPDLGQLSVQPQPVQSQPQVMPGREDEPKLPRRAQHQQLQLGQHLT